MVISCAIGQPQRPDRSPTSTRLGRYQSSFPGTCREAIQAVAGLLAFVRGDQSFNFASLLNAALPDRFGVTRDFPSRSVSISLASNLFSGIPLSAS